MVTIAIAPPFLVVPTNTHMTSTKYQDGSTLEHVSSRQRDQELEITSEETKRRGKVDEPTAWHRPCRSRGHTSKGGSGSNWRQQPIRVACLQEGCNVNNRGGMLILATISHYPTNQQDIKSEYIWIKRFVMVLVNDGCFVLKFCLAFCLHNELFCN